jgi:ABC-2 type transport system permease protein
VVFRKELSELWIGAKGLSLILLYCILLGLYSYVLATNTETKLMPLREMVLEMVKAAIAVGLFISMVIGADSVSGERERATLEGLLLTPTSRRQIVLGKFLAALSPWPVALAIGIKYWDVVSQGHEVFGRAAIWGALLGTLLALAFAGLGMLVSIWCNTNKTSMFVSLSLYVLFLVPVDIVAGPAKVQRTAEQWQKAYLIEWVNPVGATGRFLSEVLVRNQAPEGLLVWLTTPALLAAAILLLLFVHASPSLRLEAQTASRLRRYWRRTSSLGARVPGVAPKSQSSSA